MLKVYRRHNPARCSHTERTWRRCSCPLWVDGTLAGKRYHKTLKTRNWDTAQKMAQELEASGKPEPAAKTIQEATEAFIRDAEARGLRPPSVYKYKLLFKQLTAFAADKGLRYITECDVENLRLFRESWANKNFSARKKLEALRTFFKFVHESGWLPTNPAKVIKPPKTDDPPTLPYSKDEFQRVLAACDKYRDKQNAIRLRALTLLLRYSGLRISDAVTLTKQQINGDVLTLRTAKTGTDVRVPLPKTVIDALDAIPTDNYYFWSGRGTKKSCVGDYQRAFKKLYELAKVENGHAHRWRDTFAVELLLDGIPLEQVSALLGHQSIKVTERHYSPWVKARQDQLEAAVRSTFKPHNFATYKSEQRSNQ
jgi:integrase/recombinase XerD